MGQSPGLLAAPTLFAARYPGSLFHARPVEVLPGHGHPTNMDRVRRYSRDCLVDLRDRIGAQIHEGGGLTEAYYSVPSAYAHLDTFDGLASRNAGRVLGQREFEGGAPRAIRSAPSR